MKRRIIFKNLLCLSLLFCLPFCLGWQEVSLTECLKTAKPAIQENFCEKVPKEFSGLTANQILEKATSIFYKQRTMKIAMEIWMETPLYHIKAHLKDDVENIDNYKTEGQINFSFLIPSVSTSSWVQAYQINGIPFTWDLNKREWLQEELKISGKDSKKALEYGIFKSLFTINEGAAQPDSVKILGIEKRKGKDCFVLQYKLDPKLFKRWNVSGNISVKTWISKENFLPYASRCEGIMADMYFLELVDYSGFNAPVEFSLPKAVAQTGKEEREKLEGKINTLVAFVAKTRGWVKGGDIPISFKDRVSFRDYLCAQIEKDYTQQRLQDEAYILKWLGLLASDADYKESMLNGLVSSLAALYDPEKKIIYVGTWLHPSLAEAVVVHELAHGLQDSNIGLEKFLGQKEHKDNFDLLYARKSVVEGEAMAIMLEYLLRPQGKSFQNLKEIFPLIEENILKGSEYVRENVTYNVYGYGANFIQSCLRQYNEWANLDKVYRNPPSLMREVIHPQRYLNKQENSYAKKELEPTIKFPGSWKKISSVKCGEFVILLSLRQALEKEKAEKSSSGWQDDTLQVFENEKGNKLILFVSEWETQEDASEFLQGYKDWLKKRHPEVNPVEAENNKIFWETNDEGIFFCWKDNDSVKIVWSDSQNKEELEAFIKGRLL